MSRRLITSDEATPANGQHERPCSDCPFARTALPGWLGGASAEDWMGAVGGDLPMDCHVLEGAQCAGGAIFRANLCKLPRSREALRLKPDTKRVFATREEFMEHHCAD